MDPRSVPIGTPLWFRQQVSAGPFCPVPGSLLFIICRKFTVSLNTDFVWRKLSLSRLRLFAKDVSGCDRYLGTRFIRDSKSLILYIYEIYGTGINAPSGCGYASRVHPCTLAPDNLKALRISNLLCNHICHRRTSSQRLSNLEKTVLI